MVRHGHLLLNFPFLLLYLPSAHSWTFEKIMVYWCLLLVIPLSSLFLLLVWCFLSASCSFSTIFLFAGRYVMLRSTWLPFGLIQVLLVVVFICVFLLVIAGVVPSEPAKGEAHLSSILCMCFLCWVT